MQEAILVLEDGKVFKGKSAGKIGTTNGEICFNTGMTGYQEIYTDPSYFGQILVNTNVHIGNYGTKSEEVESDTIKIAGMVCRNFNIDYSRSKADASIQDYFEKNNLVAISDVDTREIVRYIRQKGAMNAIISSEIDDVKKLLVQLKAMPSMAGLELASKVSTPIAYALGHPDAKYKVAVFDYGVKKNILRCFVERDCYVKVFPAQTPLEEVKQWNPDGYFLSNGPGDPEPLFDAIEVAKQIIAENLPLFGICLGHQVIGLANGISTYKMFNGHRGINHPVKNLISGKGEITSQNHGFAVVREELEKHLDMEITHIHLNDNTVAGMRMKSKNCFSVQYHPEASPGPHDSSYLFDEFIANIKKVKLQEV
ncbi:MAG: glutamine-hydrolyzing carbamoyl-phosphate synthase small subunit [Flavobacterium sp.]|nr:glutamine-hydrolyzing carbamoyl-phosphate synthase small subunit [Flavobacterium sp.]